MNIFGVGAVKNKTDKKEEDNETNCTLTTIGALMLALTASAAPNNKSSKRDGNARPAVAAKGGGHSAVHVQHAATAKMNRHFSASSTRNSRAVAANARAYSRNNGAVHRNRNFSNTAAVRNNRSINSARGVEARREAATRNLDRANRTAAARNAARANAQQTR